MLPVGWTMDPQVFGEPLRDPPSPAQSGLSPRHGKMGVEAARGCQPGLCPAEKGGVNVEGAMLKGLTLKGLLGAGGVGRMPGSLLAGRGALPGSAGACCSCCCLEGIGFFTLRLGSGHSPERRAGARCAPGAGVAPAGEDRCRGSDFHREGGSARAGVSVGTGGHRSLHALVRAGSQSRGSASPARRCPSMPDPVPRCSPWPQNWG